MSELHRCHRGLHCVNYEVDADIPALRRGAQINAAEGLCAACARHVHRAIVDIPRDYLDLESMLASSRDGLRQTVSGTRELAVPLSLTISAHQHKMLHEAQCWAESTAEVLGVWWDTQAARDSRPGPVLHRASALLSGAFSALLALRGTVHAAWMYGEWTTLERDGMEGAVVLLDLHRRARALAGQSRLVNHLQAPCPRCERVALQREDGDDAISCAACGRVYSRDEYDRLCTMLLTRRECAA